MCQTSHNIPEWMLNIILMQKEANTLLGQGGSNFETIFSTRVFATIFSLFEMFVLTISSPYQKKESYVKV